LVSSIKLELEQLLSDRRGSVAEICFFFKKKWRNKNKKIFFSVLLIDFSLMNWCVIEQDLGINL